MTDWYVLASLWVASIAAIASIAAVAVSYLAMRSEIDPDVIVYAKHDTSRPSVIVIVVENAGRGIAYDVEFSLSSEIPSHAWGIARGENDPPRTMTEGPLISGIPVLAPGDKRTITWGQYGGLSDALAGAPVNVEASFRRKRGRNWLNRELRTYSRLEVDSFAGTDASEPPEVRQVRELEKIRIALESGQRQLRTIAQIVSKPEIEAAIQRARSRKALLAGADPKLPAADAEDERITADRARKHGI